MRLKLLCNPAAGRGKAARNASDAAHYLRGQGAEVDLQMTRDREDLVDSAAALDPSTFDRLAVIGGDGTLHHLVRNLDLTAHDLAILPSGSGDDFARALGIPHDLRQACDVALGGKVRPVDVPSANSIRFMGVASLGFDCEVARYASEVKGLRGSMVYLWSILRVLPRFQPKRVTIESDGKRWDEELMFAVVANSPRYGGGIHIAPDAKVDDRLLDLYVIQRCSRGTLLTTLPRAYSGGHVKSSFVWSTRGTEFRLSSASPLDIFADGEYVTTTPAIVRTTGDRLNIVVPQ